MTSKKSDVLKDAEDVKEVDGVVTVEATKTEEPKVEGKKTVEGLVKSKRISDLKKRKEEIDLYLSGGASFISRRGAKVKIPPLSGKAEKRALSALIGFVVGDPEVLKLFTGGGGFVFSPEIITKLLKDSSGDNAYKCLQDMSAALLGATNEWVDKNLLLGEMVKVVRPFFLIEGDLLAEMRTGKTLPELTEESLSEK